MEGRVSTNLAAQIRAELTSCDETMAIAAGSFDFAQELTARLFPRERSVKPRLATISCVAMDDSALGRLIDGGNCCANLIGTALRR